ncbi:hypothetical protein BJY52DRAFT_1420701 [Lactarius psammicola]|nr:hypothetical protein BJY52DRAFT_1420701 [Lactarius psammicola]
MFSSSVRTPCRVDETPTDVPPFDNNISIPVSLQPVDQTTAESHHYPATSPNPVAALVIQGGIDTTTTIPPYIPEPSASSPPISISSTSPPGAVSLQHIAEHCTPPDDPDFRAPSSPTLVPNNTLPTESHSLMPTPAASGPFYPQLSSTPPDPETATEGKGSAKAVLRKEMTAFHSPAIREDVMTPDLPPQSPSPPSIINVAIAGLSQGPLDAKQTGHRPPRPSHGQYDIV